LSNYDGGMPDVIDQFIATAHRVVWCTLATVDRHNRPRSRVVHPLWERDGAALVGWVGTRPTPLKRAHLEHAPFVSASYWDPRHDVAVAECAAAWHPDREAVWERLRPRRRLWATTRRRSGPAARAATTSPSCA
jgi:hypothetical protein